MCIKTNGVLDVDEKKKTIDNVDLIKKRSEKNLLIDHMKEKEKNVGHGNLIYS